MKMRQRSGTAGVILAAGMSTRLGKPKQLVKLGGRHLIEWVVDAVITSKLDGIVLVLGHEHRKIQNVLKGKRGFDRIRVVIAEDYEKGMSFSFRAGLGAVRNEFSSVMFILGDQPLLKTQEIDFLLDEFRRSGKSICVPAVGGKRGNPVIFGNELYDALDSVKGDMGAREVIANHSEEVYLVPLDSARCFFDVDTETDLEEVKRLLYLQSRP
jgi:molybdenum cofactor cytidylyltransferase